MAATAGLVADLGLDMVRSGSASRAPIVGGTAMMAANIDKSWVGVDAVEGRSRRPSGAVRRPQRRRCGRARGGPLRRGEGRAGRDPPADARDGDRLGAVRRQDLVPNTELGHIQIRGKDAERRASSGARERKGSWSRWAPLLDEYLDRVDA